MNAIIWRIDLDLNVHKILIFLHLPAIKSTSTQVQWRVYVIESQNLLLNFRLKKFIAETFVQDCTVPYRYLTGVLTC